MFVYCFEHQFRLEGFVVVVVVVSLFHSDSQSVGKVSSHSVEHLNCEC